MEPAKINSLTHKPASRADAGAAPAARAGASLAAVHLIEPAPYNDAGAGDAPPHSAPGSPHAHAHAVLTQHTIAPGPAPLAGSAVIASSPPSSVTVEQESGVQVALSTQAVAAAADPNTQENSRASPPTPPPFAPVIGAGSYPSASQLPAAPPSPRASAQQQHQPSAISQARDAERLAGLTLKPEIPAAPFRHTYDVLALITVIVGVLLLIFL